MTSLTELAAHPLVHALGWTLVHFCWQGALVAGMLWCVLALLGGGSAQARHAAACSAMLLMVALPLITLSRIAIAEYEARSAGHGAAMVLDMSFFLNAGSGGAAAPWSERLAPALDHAMPWLLAVWLLGAMYFVLRLNVGLIAARRMRSVGIEAAPGELQQMFEALCDRMGVTRAVRLLISARVEVPTVIGWLRPVVLLPVSCLTGLSVRQIEAIVCHELAHVRRNDYLVSVLQSLAEALLFYHPAVWWVSRQVRRERECCCDALAVASCGDALTYARALSYLEEQRAALPDLALGANGGVLSMRIKRLLGYKDDAGAPQFAALLLAALIVAIAGSYTATRVEAQKKAPPTIVSTAASGFAPDASPVDGPDAAPDASRQPAAPNVSGEQMLRGPYKTWLTQDVKWIITDQERAAFLRLTDADQRDAFIEQFWTRRDAAGASPGSYRDAYYGRMAYANEHFASETRAGWSTDRGHMYLLHGKPQSIDSHPRGGEYQKENGTGTISYPFEVWHYGAIAGFSSNVDAVFVDTCSCGEYNLTVDGTGPVASNPDVRTAPANVTVPLLTPVKLDSASQTALRMFAPVKVKTTPLPVTKAILPAVALQMPLQPTELAQSEPRQIASVAVAPSNPDLSCTYYSHTGAEAGTCESSPGANPVYTCRTNSGQGRNQLQSGCESKVKRLLELQIPDPAPIAAAKIPASIMRGQIVTKVDPIYPGIARAAHVQGVVVLSATISKQGTIGNLSPLSGPPMLISSAMDAVKQWVYKPYLLNGEPTEVQTTISVNFSFGESPEPSSILIPTSPARSSPRMADGAIPPVAIFTREPEFTEEARKAKFIGAVLVNLIVDEHGNPQKVHVVRGVGMGLDAKAIEAVKKYRFKPATKDGQDVAEPINIEVNFQVF